MLFFTTPDSVTLVHGYTTLNYKVGVSILPQPNSGTSSLPKDLLRSYRHPLGSPCKRVTIPTSHVASSLERYFYRYVVFHQVSWTRDKSVRMDFLHRVRRVPSPPYPRGGRSPRPFYVSRPLGTRRRSLGREVGLLSKTDDPLDTSLSQNNKKDRDIT